MAGASSPPPVVGPTANLDERVAGLTFGGRVFGSSGVEGIIYSLGASDLYVDRNIEAVQLGGYVKSYSYQQQGNNLNRP